MNNFVYNNRVFETKVHAQWAAFFDTLSTEWHYKVEEDVTFTLPTYHGGLYMLINASGVKPNLDLIRRFDKPVWFVTEAPNTRISLLYYVDHQKMGMIDVMTVIPALGDAYSANKLFTNPRAVTNYGYIKTDVLEKHGKDLVRLLDQVTNAKIVEQFNVPTSQADKKQAQGQSLRDILTQFSKSNFVPTNQPPKTTSELAIDELFKKVMRTSGVQSIFPTNPDAVQALKDSYTPNPSSPYTSIPVNDVEREIRFTISTRDDLKLVLSRQGEAIKITLENQEVVLPVQQFKQLVEKLLE